MKSKIGLVIAFLFLNIAGTIAQVRIESKEIEEAENKNLEYIDNSLKEFDYNVSKIAVEIQNITVKEKDFLRLKVDSITNLVDTKVLTEEEAQIYKTKYAQEASDRIEKETNRMQDSLTYVVQQRVNYAMKNGEYLKVADTAKRKITTITIGGGYDEYTDTKKGERHLGERRTTFRLGVVYGMSNLATKGAFANSDIRYIPSVFFQGGFYLKTRLLKNSNLLHLRYGFTGETSDLKPTEHRYFRIENGQTVIAEHEKELRKSRLSIGSFQIPFYLEFDFTKPKIDKNTGKKYFRSEESWRIGIGGYVNFINKDSKGHQVYRYREDGVQYRVDKKENLGISKTRFGLGAYMGYGSWALQFQYELTPLFKNNDIKQHLYSVGIRLDM